MMTYLAFRLGFLVVPYLPRRVGYALSVSLGYLLYLFASKRRQIARRNLRNVLGPDLDPKRLNAVVRKSFIHLALSYFDLFRLPSLRFSQLESMVTLEGWHHLEDALKQGKGVILAAAHLGPLHVVGQILAARGIRSTVPVEVLHNPRVFRLITEARRSKGITYVPLGYSGLKVAMAALKRGEVVVLAYDGAIEGKASPFKFFGQDALLPTGAVEMALRTGVALLPVFTFRVGFEKFLGRIEAPLQVDTTLEADAAVRGGMLQLLSLLEHYLLRYPEQWIVASSPWREPESRRVGTLAETHP